MVRKIGSSRPSVMRRSIYRLKRTYWQHCDDRTFSRRLFELEGKNECIQILGGMPVYSVI